MKIYQAGTLEIHDLSGKKTVEELKKEFNKTEITDITQEYNAKIASGRLAGQEKTEKEKLIQDKMREMAISELIKEGKITE